MSGIMMLTGSVQHVQSLNKGDKSSATNTDDYENNSEGSLTTIVTTPKTFVPMKFTYVTIPGDLKAS